MVRTLVVLIALGLDGPIAVVPAAWAQPPTALPGTFRTSERFDGQRVLAADGKVAILSDALTGRVIRRFEGHQEPINAVAILPGASMVLTASGSGNPRTGPPWDSSIRLWDVATGREVRRIAIPGSPVEFLEPAADGRRFLTLGYHAPGRIWEVATGRCVADLGPMFPMPLAGGHAASLGDDGATVLGLAHGMGRVVLWDAQRGGEIRSIDHDDGAFFRAAEISGDGRQILTTSSTGAARLWDATSGRPLDVPEPPGGDLRHALFAGPEGGMILAFDEGDLAIRDRVGDTRRVRFAAPGQVQAILVDPSARHALISWYNHNDGDQGVSLVDLLDGRERRRIRPSDQGQVVGFGPDGATFAVVLHGACASLWDVATGREVSRQP